jgi:nicotinamidase-related amidase
MSYDPSTTAILPIDPYNDFLSEGGKIWPRVKAVAEETQLLNHLRKLVSAARVRGLKIFFVPHHRWEPGDYVSFDNATPYQLTGANAQIFAKGSWGGTFHNDFQPQPDDVVVHEHLGSSGFANTDLDLQLKQHGVRHIILIGMIANTCIESTGRFGMELGYRVTLVKGGFGRKAISIIAVSAPCGHQVREWDGGSYCHYSALRPIDAHTAAEKSADSSIKRAKAMLGSVERSGRHDGNARLSAFS